MSIVQEFFDQKLIQRTKTQPDCLQESGLKNAKLGIVIEGVGGGQWTLSFDSKGFVTCLKDPASSLCETVVTTSEKIFEGLLAGNVNIPMAFLTRKLKVKGETQLAVKLGLALKSAFLK